MPTPSASFVFRRRAPLAALLAGLVWATPAAAQLAGGEVANDVCLIESNRVTRLADHIRQRLIDAAYTAGVSQEECDDFVADQVANCIAILTINCRLALDSIEEQIQRSECKLIEDKVQRKQCETNAFVDHRDDNDIGGVIQSIGMRACRNTSEVIPKGFAGMMRETCLEGPQPPAPPVVLPVVCRLQSAIPTDIVTAVDVEYDIDTMDEKTCSTAAKSTGKGCKSAVKDFGTCEDKFDTALNRADQLVCAALEDPEDQSACLADAKGDLKILLTDNKNNTKTNSTACEDVPPTVLSRCDD